MSDWQAAWEREKHAVGRAVHEAWAAEKIRQGFSDHAAVDVIERREYDYGDAGDRGYLVSICGRCARDVMDVRHHPDMLDYDDLAPHVQEYDIQTGIVGFRMGYEAAMREGRR